MNIFGDNMIWLPIFYYVGTILTLIFCVCLAFQLYRTRFIFYLMVPVFVAVTFPRIAFYYWGGLRYALGILSNVDDDLLAGTLRRLTVDFELIVTAEQVRSYKPAHGHFDEARRQIGDRRWLHAAQSWFHDVEPACKLAIPSAWVNRKNESVHGTARPQHQVGNMAGLADLLCSSPRVS